MRQGSVGTTVVGRAERESQWVNIEMGICLRRVMGGFYRKQHETWDFGSKIVMKGSETGEIGLTNHKSIN